VESLREARDACRRAANARREGLSEEYVVQGVGDAVDALDDLLTGGPGDPEELYERIFSSFCIGK
jgi:tRNA U34 5-carboxymethylaminomethyl modifying GTPase MnmE/TrmE